MTVFIMTVFKKVQDRVSFLLKAKKLENYLSKRPDIVKQLKNDQEHTLNEGRYKEGIRHTTVFFDLEQRDLFVSLVYSSGLKKEVAVSMLRRDDVRKTLAAYYRLYKLDELMRMLNLN